MKKIPVNFRTVAAASDKFSRVSYGGEEENSADLFDLVNSFLEREIENREQRGGDDQDEGWNNVCDDDVGDGGGEMENNFESRDLLNILSGGENDAVRRRIHAEVEKAYREISGGKSSSPDFKRRLAARLRNRGFDAGLCKSKCERNGRRPFGDYEYVDVNAAGNRYIIEVFLAGEFTIARPTVGYAALLEVFPPIFVGGSDELKQVVRLMCDAMRKSMKSAGIFVPPWRRLTYMKSKWFGSYERTANETANRNVGSHFSGYQRADFAPVKGISLYCRDEFASEAGVTTGNLAAILNRKEMLI